VVFAAETTTPSITQIYGNGASLINRTRIVLSTNVMDDGFKALSSTYISPNGTLSLVDCQPVAPP